MRQEALILLDTMRTSKLPTPNGGVCWRNGLAGTSGADDRCRNRVDGPMEPFEKTEVNLCTAALVWVCVAAHASAAFSDHDVPKG